jgi:hypothetical protein
VKVWEKLDSLAAAVEWWEARVVARWVKSVSWEA